MVARLSKGLGPEAESCGPGLNIMESSRDRTEGEGTQGHRQEPGIG